MSYIDGMIAAVPTANKDAYLDHARQAAELFKEFGATRIVETWGAEVPEGKLTDFPRSVQAKPDETVVFSWITWPDKAARDAGWGRLMQDARMHAMQLPFDGQRMIYGGFDVVLDV